MWGGWYQDPLLMEEIVRLKKIYDEEPIRKDKPLSPDVVFFADESGYANLYSQSPHLKGITKTRTAMGNTGVPYDSFMVEDADSILENYKAAVFVMPIPSETGKRAMELCEKMGIPYLTATADRYELTVDEVREFYKANGIHFYTEEKDVVYVGYTGSLICRPSITTVTLSQHRSSLGVESPNHNIAPIGLPLLSHTASTFKSRAV